MILRLLPTSKISLGEAMARTKPESDPVRQVAPIAMLTALSSTNQP
jgi:hypothetical protein